jgi:hypothetical protein
MHERLLDKNDPPGEDRIREWTGPEGYALLLELEAFLGSHYQLSKELRFPFGNQYGWGYKYGHKSSHLCYTFFESGSFTVTLQLGDGCLPAVERILSGLSQKVRELWQNRYPCGERGGWIHYRVMDANDLKDVLELIKIKKKPAGQSHTSLP